ncbi:uncharacterized protein LOC113793653 [Dermatophagoides pteronyssinus]|uniref:uncharacterized protein LOC113793653 n=1 Tax=Dermatophagoides pteronyssinus TaxID=6956 RepID=UPI003F67149B
MASPQSTTASSLTSTDNPESPSSMIAISTDDINIHDKNDQSKKFKFFPHIFSCCGHQQLIYLKRLNSLDIIYAIGSFIAVLGCAWQLIDVSRIYFAYDTNVNVMFERETKVEIPAITICMDLFKVANDEYIEENYSNQLKHFAENKVNKYSAYKKLFQNLTLYELLNNATYSSEKVFNKCRIIKPIAIENNETDDYINCTFISPIHESLTDVKKCFSIGLQLNNQSDDYFYIDHDMTIRDNGFPLYQISLFNKYIESPMILMHSRSIPFLGFIGGQTNVFRVNNTRSSFQLFNYFKTINDLLEPPFKTDCRRYEEIGYKSLMHCMNRCKSNFFIRNFNGQHGDVPTDNSFDLNMYFAPSKFKENKTLDKIMSNECLTTCSKRQECHSEFYTMSMMDDFERKPMQNRYEFDVYFSSTANTHYKHQPRMELVEFICFYASTISLWFGFSIIAFSRSVLHIIHQNALAKRNSSVSTTKNDKNNETNDNNNIEII